ncbi:hypothetical protein [Desulfovibrio sp. TomC]|uniref:hypothetical protein n=1 Tax=Desulfovibrio sp. TomC TaxID=1562888 RepID=UPI0005BD36D7|nr:hypothetical protein [Desulfovibrio sp. TomC]
MDIQMNIHNGWQGDSLQAYQEATKSIQSVTSSTTSSKDDPKTGEKIESGDTISISEEARKKQEESSGPTSVTTLSAQASATDGESSDDTTSDPKAILLKQIDKVQKQLQDAQDRLASAMSKTKHDTNSGKDKASQETDEQTQDAGTAQTENPENSDNPEVKTIATEVNLLTMTLATLNAQLLKQEQKGGASGTTTGTAGINEGSGLSGGVGERLPVNA